MNYIITNKEDQSIRSIPSGEKYLVLNKVVFDYNMFNNEEHILVKGPQGARLEINPGFISIKDMFDKFKLIDPKFEYNIDLTNGITEYYKFSIDVVMVIDTIRNEQKLAGTRYSKKIDIGFKYIDFRLKEINEFYDNNTKILTKIAIPPGAKYGDVISEILNKKIRLTDDQINKFNLSIYIYNKKMKLLLLQNLQFCN